MPTVGSVASQIWKYLDLAEAAKTGMTSPADVTLTLHRFNSSTGEYVAAAETVTWDEVGVTGYYTISFTPTVAANYILYLKELNVDSLGRETRFEFDVMTAGSSAASTYTDAFCGEADIERYLQQTISATTNPTSAQTANFAAARAAIIQTLLAAWGYSTTPATITVGTRLEFMAREANAIGAAIDYTAAQTYGKSPSRTDRLDTFQFFWDMYVKAGGYLHMEVKGNLASLATNHILSGDTIAYTEGTAPTSQPIGRSMGDLY